MGLGPRIQVEALARAGSKMDPTTVGGKAENVGNDVSGWVDVGRSLWNFLASVFSAGSLAELEDKGGGGGGGDRNE